VSIGIKDNTDPDNGTETKFQEQLADSWESYTYTLADFVTADLTHLYIVTEFVFDGPAASTVEFRNIRMTK
jgi:hypothetical protein